MRTVRPRRPATLAFLVGSLVVAGLTLAPTTSTTVAQTAPARTAPPAGTPAAVVDQYCVRCHSARLRTGGLVLENLDPAHPGPNADIWERVVARLRAGSMPPPGLPRPDTATYRTVAHDLETALDRAWWAAPNPGRNSAVHRLNRTEYNNAIRDLLALDIDVTSLLPV